MVCLSCHLGSAEGQREIYILRRIWKHHCPNPRGKKLGEDEPNLCIVWLHISIGERAELVDTPPTFSAKAQGFTTLLPVLAVQDGLPPQPSAVAARESPEEQQSERRQQGDGE